MKKTKKRKKCKGKKSNHLFGNNSRRYEEGTDNMN